MPQVFVEQIVDAIRTTEGAGFPIRRPFPTAELPMVDPFLMLDHIGPVTWAPGEAVGAPDHPHRGFETISYVLAGHKVHRDSQGGHGRLGPGDVQWMTAGGGIVHSELPAPEFKASGGLSHGFQIWVNLPARDKMCAPRYQDVPCDRIPEASSPDGLARVKVIAGEALDVRAVIDTRTPVTFLHFMLEAGATLTHPLVPEHATMAYVFKGALELGTPARTVSEGQLARFSGEGELTIASERGGQCLLLGGEPLGEPVARWGPFVMNTAAEIKQAMADYRAGRMGTIGI